MGGLGRWETYYSTTFNANMVTTHELVAVGMVTVLWTSCNSEVTDDHACYAVAHNPTKDGRQW